MTSDSMDEDEKAELVAYLDGELDDEAAQALEARLSQDPAARAELDALRQVYGLLDYLPRPEPSNNFTNRTMERLALVQQPRETGKMPVPAGRWWLAPLGYVAILGVLFALGWFGSSLLGKPQKKQGDNPNPPAVETDDDFMQGQAKALREQYQKLEGKERADFVRHLRAEERKTRHEWLIASRVWTELQSSTPLPARLDDFPGPVQSYVKEYLKHFLTEEEWDRLEKAQGQWPLYPMTLVELADKHPPALPGDRGHDRYDELPAAVQKAFKKPPPAAKKGKAEGTWPGFALYISQVAHSRDVVFPNELWPYNYKGLSPEMQKFVDHLIKSVLDNDEVHELLNKTPNKWPEYPLAIQELSRKKGLEPPWFTLPGPRKNWDIYRLKIKLEAERLPPEKEAAAPVVGDAGIPRLEFWRGEVRGVPAKESPS